MGCTNASLSMEGGWHIILICTDAFLSLTLFTWPTSSASWAIQPALWTWLLESGSTTEGLGVCLLMLTTGNLGLGYRHLSHWVEAAIWKSMQWRGSLIYWYINEWAHKRDFRDKHNNGVDVLKQRCGQRLKGKKPPDFSLQSGPASQEAWLYFLLGF